MPRFSIRFKLLLLSLVLLSIPYVGFQYLRETERYLQSGLEDSLLAVAGALAVSLEYQSPIFRNSTQDVEGDLALFVHALKFPIQIDGYIEEWVNYLDWSDSFSIIEKRDNESLQNRLRTLSLSEFRLVLGEYAQNLYVMVDVTDSDIRYQESGEPKIVGNDSVEIAFIDSSGKRRSVFLMTTGPGPITAYEWVENWEFTFEPRIVPSISGAWQENENGYAVEITLPLHLISGQLGVIVHDGDILGTAQTSARTPVQSLAERYPPSIIAGSNRQHTRSKPNDLLRTSAQLQQLIDRIGLKQGQRLWVLNRQGQVLASGGSLSNERKQGAINFIYTWILPMASESFVDDLNEASRLKGDEVLNALQGAPATRWRSSPDERAVIVSAAHPVRTGNELVGVVVVEETTNSIQTLQRKATADLFNRSILIFVGVTAVLLVFATRLSWRIIQLRNTASRAIDDYGRVVGDIKPSRANDELGDLSRSYASMLSRLSEYNTYLESMAGKLSHEIRTPLTVVATSLENLHQAADDDERLRYITRAQEGTERLRRLVARLSEAARLEQSISAAHKEQVELRHLIDSCHEGYEKAYPGHNFRFHCRLAESEAYCSADLVVQMLDKLVSNAVEFSDEGQDIELTLERRQNHYEIQVTNKGPTLPDDMRSQIFNSMISLREKSNAGEPHLGLGLFIVRLIAEFHDGEARAENLPNEDGVSIVVTIAAPRA